MAEPWKPNITFSRIRKGVFANLDELLYVIARQYLSDEPLKNIDKIILDVSEKSNDVRKITWEDDDSPPVFTTLNISPHSFRKLASYVLRVDTRSEAKSKYGAAGGMSSGEVEKKIRRLAKQSTREFAQMKNEHSYRLGGLGENQRKIDGMVKELYVQGIPLPDIVQKVMKKTLQFNPMHDRWIATSTIKNRARTLVRDEYLVETKGKSRAKVIEQVDRVRKHQVMVPKNPRKNYVENPWLISEDPLKLGQGGYKIEPMVLQEDGSMRILSADELLAIKKRIDEQPLHTGLPGKLNGNKSTDIIVEPDYRKSQILLDHVWSSKPAHDEIMTRLHPDKHEEREASLNGKSTFDYELHLYRLGSSMITLMHDVLKLAVTAKLDQAAVDDILEASHVKLKDINPNKVKVTPQLLFSEVRTRVKRGYYHTDEMITGYMGMELTGYSREVNKMINLGELLKMQSKLVK